MATATDPDGSGFKSWRTSTYSTALAFAERLHNLGTATITPARQKERNGERANQTTGHSYVIEFQTDAHTYRIRDLDTHEVVVKDTQYESGADLDGIVPFKFKIEGETRQGDRFLIRTQAPLPATYAVHQGEFVYPAALFIEAVKTRPELAAEFDEDAGDFLAFINKHIFEKNQVDWLDMGELGGAYRFEPFITDGYPNRIMPHNQYGALARAWLVLKDIEGAHPQMGPYAEKMARYLHNHMHLFTKEDGDGQFEWYQWYYWDWTDYGEHGHLAWEDTAHAGLTMSFAVVAARRGVVFTDDDMRRIANCWLRVMWNGDDESPKMASRVDGSEGYKFSPVSSRWGLLSQWDRKAYDLALKAFEASSEEERAAAAAQMLIIAKRAGVTLK